MPAQGGLPPAPHHLIPHVAGQGTGDAIGVEASAGKDLLQHRVLPPTGLGGQLPPFVAEPVQIDDDDFSGAGAMDSGSYFTNLMSNGFTNPMGYATGQPDDSPQPNDIPQPDDIGAQDHGAATAK